MTIVLRLSFCTDRSIPFNGDFIPVLGDTGISSFFRLLSKTMIKIRTRADTPTININNQLFCNQEIGGSENDSGTGKSTLVFDLSLNKWQIGCRIYV